MAKAGQGTIRVGIGGWDYDPWRGTFYPVGLAKTKQLHYASRQLTAIEINATYYKLQKPDLFRRWAADVPDGFVFAIKGSRFCTNRRVLAEAGESVAKFCAQGLIELGDKLGPILWQFMETKKFDAEDFRAFLGLLPRSQDGVALRHAVEVRSDTFATPEFVAMAREANVAICTSDSDDYPLFADATADFAYARLMRSREEEEAGYPAAELDRWAGIANGWARGTADDLPRIDPSAPAVGPRDVYLFMISGAKVRAPAAARAMLDRLELAD